MKSRISPQMKQSKIFPFNNVEDLQWWAFMKAEKIEIVKYICIESFFRLTLPNLLISFKFPLYSYLEMRYFQMLYSVCLLIACSHF